MWPHSPTATAPSSCRWCTAPRTRWRPTSRSCARETGLITLDDGYGNTGATRSAITFLDGERGILRYRGYPIEQLAESSTFLEVAYLLIYGELPTREQLDHFVAEITHHTLIREEMRHFFDSFPTRRAPDGGARLRHGRDEHLLPRQPRDPRSRRGGAHHAAADRQAADPRGLVLQEGDRPALRLSAQRPGLRGQPAAHDVRRAVRAVRGQAGGGRGARPAADPARRPRAELLHRRPCAWWGARHANLYASHQRRHRRPVGTAARRRQRGGDRDPGARSSRTAATSRSTSTGPRTRTTSFKLAGFGHRVYKNFDPRATDHQARRGPGAGRHRRRRASCSRSPSSSRRSPSTTSTSSSASCTRTSTSTPASSTAPSASRRTCSPTASPSAACPAGSRSGRR